jgi:dihydrofolate reductase
VKYAIMHHKSQERPVGKIVVSEFITFDGVIEDPGGTGEHPEGGWSFRLGRSEQGMTFKFEELMAADAQLLGRITYDGFAKAWPTMEGTGEFGEKMNAMPKHVVSSTPLDLSWQNSEVITINEAAMVKDRYEGDILVSGSAQLVRGLAERGLVDEYRLMTFPIVLGSGKRLFDGAPVMTLTLAETRPMGDSGVTVQVYTPAR